MASLKPICYVFLYTNFFETWYVPYYKFNEMHDGL
jgi:hypothetical protein